MKERDFPPEDSLRRDIEGPHGDGGFGHAPALSVVRAWGEKD
jgi:hypothetical protein